MFLDLRPNRSGISVAGRRTGRGAWTSLSSQSLYRKDAVKDFVAEYGQVIVDECHHISRVTMGLDHARSRSEVQSRSVEE